MTQVKTNFSAQLNGFRFVNRFEMPFSVNFRLPLVGKINLGDVVYGLCGGMCFGALDYFHSGEFVPEYAQVDDLDQKFLIYLWDRQLDSLKLPVVFKVLEWMLTEDKDLALRMARYEIPKLRRMLDRGEPAVLALIRVQGVGDPTKNHQVMATGYEYNLETRDLTIQLYDPNHPNQEPTLSMNLEKPSEGIGISQSTGEPLRGLFIINYKPQKSIPKTLPTRAAISFGMEGFRLQWPVDSRRVNQRFGENPDSYKPFGLPGHEGLDLFAPTDANVYAAADGEVTQVGHPDDHPYGLQVRLNHSFGGKQYKTIYAHLRKTFVKVGQKVTAGERIGLADNTGNSFGSHLHLTLKVEGAKTPGYPAGIVDPWPYLQQAATTPPPPKPGPSPEPLPPPSDLVVYTMTQLNLRARPHTEAEILGLLPAGEALTVLGDAQGARAKLGKEGSWIPVQTISGLGGYVAAWFVQSLDQAFPPSDLVVYPVDQVNLRSGPATTFELLGTLGAAESLTVLGDGDNARAKLGRSGEWLQVQTSSGQRGYVAAWLVHTTGQSAPPSDFVLYATVMLNVRAMPAEDANRLTIVMPSDPLTVLGDKELARSRVGQQDQWINVRTPDGFSGYVAGWFVRAGGGAAPPPPPAGTQLAVYPTADVNLRAQPSVNSPRVGGAFRTDPLSVVEPDLNAARARVGKTDQWLHVEAKDGTRGWVAAWFVGLKAS